MVYIGSIRTPPLVGNTTFKISVFDGLPLEDPNKHLKDSLEGIKLRLFQFSQTSEEIIWLGELPEATITTEVELTEAFLERFFPSSGRI
ncbi:hypothetical protein KY290_036410 [Solanum tuberosum]|uniref:Uncharacterized protein n=1 Tax=Solanum tuberosum TaxID=4113 RepID=A0ABQ7TWB1_SOLTU|nr:hypothetical protein KY289_035931 [Solanum tuberosum]KAH0737705.1 hypothetical protein KY290_036410 [Solanum tuberosum]